MFMGKLKINVVSPVDNKERTDEFMKISDEIYNLNIVGF